MNIPHRPKATVRYIRLSEGGRVSVYAGCVRRVCTCWPGVGVYVVGFVGGWGTVWVGCVRRVCISVISPLILSRRRWLSVYARCERVGRAWKIAPEPRKLDGQYINEKNHNKSYTHAIIKCIIESHSSLNREGEGGAGTQPLPPSHSRWFKVVLGRASLSSLARLNGRWLLSIVLFFIVYCWLINCWLSLWDCTCVIK